MAFTPKNCLAKKCKFHSKPGGVFHKKGFFKNKILNQKIRRFQCAHCKKTFSSRTLNYNYRHKRPDLNIKLWKLLCEGVSIRAAARILGLTANNTYFKFLWLGSLAQELKKQLTFEAQTLFFDEMESIEHTKCKPLSIGLAVNEKYELIEAIVAKMPAKGPLAKISVRKYGFRIDEREEKLSVLFESLKQKIQISPVLVKSDAKPSYKKFVLKHYAAAIYEQHNRAEKDRHRDRLHEKLQKRIFDPMFAINQKCARLRSDIKRLARRSWCTTKKPENLQFNLDLHIVGHRLNFQFL